MKIARITVQEYGPIKSLQIVPGPFHVVYGPNESGKTALVEALSHILFKRNVANLRYGKPESAQATIEHAGTAVSFPAKKHALAMPTGDLAGLLYVAASDSFLYDAGSQQSFWEGLKLLLTRSTPKMNLAQLADRVFASVELTSTGKWEKSKQALISGRNARLQELVAYLEEIGSIQVKRQTLARMLEESQRLKAESEAIIAHRRHQEYIRVKELHDRYRDRSEQLSRYDRYQDSDLLEWQKLESEKAAREALEQRAAEDQETLRDLELRRVKLAQQQQAAQHGGLREMWERRPEPPRPVSPYPGWVALGVSCVLLVLSFVLHPRIMPYALAGFGVSVLLFAWTGFRIGRAVMARARTEKIYNLAQLVFPSVKPGEDIGSLLKDLEAELVRVETLLATKREGSISATDKKTAEMRERRLAELREQTGCAITDQLAAHLAEKRHLAAELDGLKAQLSGILGSPDQAGWRRLIDDRRAEPPDRPADPSRAETNERRLKELDRQIQETQRAVGVFEAVREQKYGIAGLEKALRERAEVERELAGYDLERRAAIACRDVLAAMSSDVDGFIADILTGDASLSEYFGFVTGRYERVEARDRHLWVTDRDGRSYDGDLLSSGARDQLRLCFRLAAIRRIYPDGAFLILDDAFLFADAPRRGRLVELLGRFSHEGHQVIYFTSDDDTRDLFVSRGAAITSL